MHGPQPGVARLQRWGLLDRVVASGGPLHVAPRSRNLVRTIGELAALRPGTSPRGMADVPNFFRRPFGPGWALMGDAGYHKEPYLAHGIMDAFRSADLLARALDDGLSGRRPLPGALAEYERRRNEALPVYRLNLQLAGLQPASPEQLRLRDALHANPVELRRFLGVAAGTVAVADFFAPENLARITREAA